MSHPINIITMRAAHDFARRENGAKFQNLAALQDLCLPRNAQRQRWTFIGDWNKSVKPYYDGRRSY